MSIEQQRRWAAAEQYRADLLRFARRHASCREDAEDAVSDAILKAGLTENLDETRMWSWLVRVTKHNCVDQHRRRPRPDHLARIHARDAMDEPPVDEDVCSRYEAIWVSNVVDQLPPRQRTVLWLKADGFGPAEIAKVLGLPYKAVESILSRGRTATRTALATTLAVLLGFARKLGRTPRAAVLASPVLLAITLALQQPIDPFGGTPEQPAPRRVPHAAVGAVRESAREHASTERAVARDPMPARRGPAVADQVPARSYVVPPVGAQPVTGTSVQSGGVTYVDGEGDFVAQVRTCIERLNLLPNRGTLLCNWE